MFIKNDLVLYISVLKSSSKLFYFKSRANKAAPQRDTKQKKKLKQNTSKNIK